uniref:Uncharacterized protein n=1 Tax=Arundo donax TaxID=35708 RepID=A0A0A9GLU5_ARUDO
MALGPHVSSRRVFERGTCGAGSRGLPLLLPTSLQVTRLLVVVDESRNRSRVTH